MVSGPHLGVLMVIICAALMVISGPHSCLTHVYSGSNQALDIQLSFGQLVFCQLGVNFLPPSVSFM